MSVRDTKRTETECERKQTFHLFTKIDGAKSSLLASFVSAEKRERERDERERERERE